MHRAILPTLVLCVLALGLSGCGATEEAQVAAAGAYHLPMIHPPPPVRPRLATEPTQPALRLVNGSR